MIDLFRGEGLPSREAECGKQLEEVAEKLEIPSDETSTMSYNRLVHVMP